MSKTLLLILGVVIAVGAAGAFYIRVADDPNAAKRYDWVLKQIGVRQELAEAPRGPAKLEHDGYESAPRTRSLSPSGQAPDAAATQDRLAERQAARRERLQQREQIELFKLGLDFMNLVVGLVGIYLALRSMGGSSARRES